MPKVIQLVQAVWIQGSFLKPDSMLCAPWHRYIYEVHEGRLDGAIGTSNEGVSVFLGLSEG